MTKQEEDGHELLNKVFEPDWITFKALRYELITKLYKAVEENCNGYTLTTYNNRIKHLDKFYNFPFKQDWLPLYTYLLQSNETNNINTYNCICNNLLKFCSICPEFNEDMGASNIERLKKLSTFFNTQSKINQKKKRENDIDWEDLLKCEESVLNKENKYSKEDILLYKLYISPGINLLPRNDFANMKIVDTLTNITSKDCNYYIKDAKKMVFYEYKTSNKYGEIMRDVPDNIIEYINFKNDYLFEWRNERINDNTMSKRITKLFTKIASRPVNIQTIRRSYSSRITKSDKVVDIVEDATNMLHSTTEHLNYQAE